MSFLHLLALHDCLHDGAVQLRDDNADDGTRDENGGVQGQRASLLAPHAGHADFEQALQIKEKIFVEFLFLGRIRRTLGAARVTARRHGPAAAQERGQAAAEQTYKDGAANDEMSAAELGHAAVI